MSPFSILLLPFCTFFFFFFQAEDGIRDWSVTGVQTCAFFFSSRRRHTRLVSDWSSDVCSSDPSSRRNTAELQSLTNLVCRLLLGSEEHTSELQSLTNLVSRLLLEKNTKTQSWRTRRAGAGPIR